MSWFCRPNCTPEQHALVHTAVADINADTSKNTREILIGTEALGDARWLQIHDRGSQAQAHGTSLENNVKLFASLGIPRYLLIFDQNRAILQECFLFTNAGSHQLYVIQSLPLGDKRCERHIFWSLQWITLKWSAFDVFVACEAGENQAVLCELIMFDTAIIRVPSSIKFSS